MQRQSLKWLKPFAFAGALLSLVPLGAAHAACGGGPGVFNVFDNGKIAITNQAGYVNESDTCKVIFSGSNDLNVTVDGYYSPSQNGDGVTGVCSAEPTDNTLNKLTLPNFPGDTRAVDIKITNQGGMISVAGTTYQKFTNTPFRWCQNPSNDNNKCFNAQNGMKKYTEADGVTFSTATESRFVISNSGEHVYNEISAENAQIYFKYDGTNPYVINKLVATNQSVLTFEPGSYFIRSSNLWDVTVINVAGTGDGSAKVRFYVKDGSTSKFIGNQSCINMNGVTTVAACQAKGTPTADVLSAQHPEKLGFYIYQGSITFGDTSFVSASIYVHNGDLTFTGNGNTAFAGEVLAANVHLGNMPNFMHYKDTGVFAELYEEIVNPKTGLFSPAAPAVPTLAVTGDYAFMVEQTEFNATSNPSTKWGGYVKAYPFLVTGATATTASWTFGNTDWDTVNTGNTPKERLSASWDSYIGLPNTTQPKIYKNGLFFTTSDGNLYAIKRSDGSYVWKWSPTLIGTYLSGIADATVAANNLAYETFLKSDPMYGQLAVYALSGLTQDATADNTANPQDGYILGTAMGGAIHYVLGLTSAGTVDTTKVWEDNRQADNTDATSFAALTATSPNAAAPVVYGAAGGKKVLYIVNNRLVQFNLGSAPPTNKATDAEFAFKASSTPMVAEKAGIYTIYIGASNGDVYTSDGNKLTGASSIGVAEPIKYLSFTTMSDNDYIWAQSTKTIAVFRLKKGETNWVRIWSSTLGGASVTDPDGSATIQSLPSVGSISDKASVVGGIVFVPFEGAENDTTCMADSYMYMFDLDPVLAQTKRLYNTYYYGDAKTGFITLGYGQAHAPQPMVFEGKLHVQGSSEQNAAVDGGRVGGGLDNPVELRAVKSLTGRRGWKELIED